MDFQVTVAQYITGGTASITNIIGRENVIYRINPNFFLIVSKNVIKVGVEEELTF
jgi:hypothetical protein